MKIVKTQVSGPNFLPINNDPCRQLSQYKLVKKSTYIIDRNKSFNKTKQYYLWFWITQLFSNCLFM